MRSSRLKVSLLILFDAMALSLAWRVAAWLARIPLTNLSARWWLLLGCAMAVQVACLAGCGIYRAIIRHASTDFLRSIVKASTAGMVLLAIGPLLFGIAVPAEALLVDWLLTMAFVGGSRFAVRCFFDLTRAKSGRRVLIYGAGDLGVIALRQLQFNKAIVYAPVGFIDDDSLKLGKIIQGLKVLGSSSQLEHIVASARCEDLVVAIAELDSGHLRGIVKRCRRQNIGCRIVPCFSKILAMEPQLRNVELSDLMRRTPRDLDVTAISVYLHGQCVLITGAAGSIGSELVRQCLKYDPEKIVALDQSEYGLYALREELGDERIDYVLCDLTNVQSVGRVMRAQRPDVVFHAAAYKHVPMLEQNAMEAIRNNIGGTKILAELADQYHVKSFVLISTDKAVRASNMMGATKRVCELFLQNYSRMSHTKFVAVRFGNVLGSSGSVVPKFLEQIRNGQPVTVTHPEATRYFMLIDEAVQLVLQAATLGKGGEIFVLNMGAPIKVAEMAEDLIFLMGRQPHVDVPLVFMGLRPGEKLNEELFTEEEIEEKTRFKDITVGKSTIVNWQWLSERLDSLLSSAAGEQCAGALTVLRELVPEATMTWHEAGAQSPSDVHSDEVINIY